MDYLTVYAMFMRETPWLAEWIEHHRLVGVERFYLFDAEPAEESARVLRPYEEAGLVRVTRGGAYTQDTQIDLYSACVREAEGRCVWAAFIDLDEFLFPLEGDSVAALLPPYEEAAALCVSWQLFGSSGLVTRPASALESFVRRAEDGFEVNRHVKVIARPPHVSHFTLPHSVHPREGRQSVNEAMAEVAGPFSDFTARRLRLNHYCVRSREDYAVKAARSRPGKCDENFWRHHDRNEVFDDSAAVRFWPRVRDALRERAVR